MADSGKEYAFKAVCAEQAERYEEMAGHMKKVVDLQPVLSVEHRNLLSVAYKNVIGQMRSSWRVVSDLLKKENNESKKEMVKEYLMRIEEELIKKCEEVLAMVKDVLLPNADTPESKVFFNKMIGDYNRYIAEVFISDVKEPSCDKTVYVDAASAAYEEASREGEELNKTHPIRLGLALNQSVFYYEIVNDSRKACDLAKQAFDDAISELDSLKDDTLKDSTLIMQLLRDNLTLWTSEELDQDEEGQE